MSTTKTTNTSKTRNPKHKSAIRAELHRVDQLLYIWKQTFNQCEKEKTSTFHAGISDTDFSVLWGARQALAYALNENAMMPSKCVDAKLIQRMVHARRRGRK